jgi:hypothetical protein
MVRGTTGGQGDQNPPQGSKGAMHFVINRILIRLHQRALQDAADFLKCMRPLNNRVKEQRETKLLCFAWLVGLDEAHA